MRYVNAQIEIAVQSEKVIQSFTDENLLRGWWGIEKCMIELKEGGIYSLIWGISEFGFKYVSTGIVRKYEPFSLLHIEKYIYLHPEKPVLGPQELIIDTQSNSSGCKIFLQQGPYPENAGADWDWYYEAVSDAWPKVLLSLKGFLEEKYGDEI